MSQRTVGLGLLAAGEVSKVLTHYGRWIAVPLRKTQADRSPVKLPTPYGPKIRLLPYAAH